MGRLRCCWGKVVGEALVKDVQKMTARRMAQRVMPEEVQRAVFVAMRFCRFGWPWGLPQKVLAVGALWAGSGRLNSEITLFCTFARRESSEVHHVGRAK